MLQWIVGSSLKFRLLVVPVAAALILLGSLQLGRAPVDVLPEFSPPQVQIQTEALGLSANEVEQMITVPMEQDLLNGVAWLKTIHSESIPGLSSIDLVFEPGTNLQRARQLVAERMTQAAVGIPHVSKPPVMLQPTSSTSRVMMIGLTSRDLSLIQMSVLARWKIRPRLMGVPGVANVAIWGERDQQLQVQVDPERLRRRGVSLNQVLTTTGNALWVSPLSFVEASTPGTGGFVDSPNQRLGIQHNLPISTPEELAQVTVEDTRGRLRLGDVARVVSDHQPLIGDALVGDGPSLLLVVSKLPGANTLDVTRGVDEALAQLRPGLAGIRTDSTIFRPASFIESAIHDLGLALLVGLALAIALLGFVLLDWRSALIGLVSMAVSLVVAALVLQARGATFNVMVLAGLVVALGVLIDDVVVDGDNLLRRLRERRLEGERPPVADVVRDASLEMRRPMVWATLILLVAGVPAALVQGLTGAFLRPLALSYLLAVLASLLVALTVAPAMSLLLFGGRPPARRPSPLAGRLQAGYTQTLSRLLDRSRGAYPVVGMIALAGLLATPQLGGGPLVPPLQDRGLLIQWEGAPGTSRPEMDRITARATRELRSLPGVRTVAAHVGRAVTSDQVVEVNAGELWVNIAPSANYRATVAAVEGVVDGYPGLRHRIVTYPQERIDQARAGGGDDLTVRVYGQDLGALRAKAEEVRRLLAHTDGVVAPHLDVPPAEPTVQIEVDLAAAQRHGIKPGDVRRAAATLLSGLEAGSLFEEQKIFEVIVRGTPQTGHSLSSIRDLLIDTPSGGHVRLGQVARVQVRSDPNIIEHDDVSRRIDVGAGVRGRPVSAVSGDVRHGLAGIRFPLESHAELVDGNPTRSDPLGRTTGVGIASAVLVFLLLQAAFASWRLAGLLFPALLLALVGGVLAAAVTGGISSLALLAGLFTVLAITLRNGFVLLRRYQQLEHDEGEPFGPGLVLRASRERVVPILLTAAATVLALLPFLVFGDRPGLETVHPLAVVVAGGLVTSTLVSLFVLPLAYLRFGSATRREEQDATV
jgi:Cu/Ag efflux pump CusA